MIHAPANDRPHSRRPAQMALAAVLILYGISGFPDPGDPATSTASAHPLPGFPHSHGGTPTCTGWICPPPSDGTDGHRPDDSTFRPAVNRPGVSQPPDNCVGVHAAGCNRGVDQGYIDPNDALNTPIAEPDEIARMGDIFADHPDNQDIDFDADEFADSLSTARRPPNRQDMADALCAAISGCGEATGNGAIQYLLDNGISFGQDDGTVNGFNLENPVTIGQVGSFFHRLEEPQEHGGGTGGGSGRTPTTSQTPGNDDPGDPDEEVCATGLDLSERERRLFVSQLEWRTLVGIEPQGEPGRRWPPHPDVPGGMDYLVVSGSPVWPVIDSGASWYVARDDGCRWEAASVQTLLTQLLPWRTSHRSAIENADTVRPGAGLDTYLSRWDNLSAAQQAQARQHHTDHDVSASCGIETARIAADSYGRCRWEVARPGVWSWQARACFERTGAGAAARECATLARGIEWFLEIIDYTSGITLQHDSAATPGSEPRRPAPVG